MPHVSWTASASRDVMRLHDFIAEKNPGAAMKAVKTIELRVDLLEQYPETGRIVDDLPSEFRELVVGFGQGGYVVRYYYDGQRVTILAVKHGREEGF